MVLMIDNYDSFTYNLVQYFGELGEDVCVVRNDDMTLAALRALKPDAIVISPGPCTPNEAGVSLEVIEGLSGQVPIFGVCLGHQSIGQAFGGKVVRAREIMHGKTSMIHHDGKGVFRGVPNPFEATRYHSLIVEQSTLPDCLDVSAWTVNADGTRDEIMGLRHRTLAVEGVQFHPESILTQHGHALLRNFLRSLIAVPITPQEALQRTIEHREIFHDEMVDLMRQIMRGEVSPTMIAAIITGLRVKKETIGEITAAAGVMRELSQRVEVAAGAPFVDIVGTGGDGANSFNISTASMFVVAAAGARVAKHGNRSVSSKSGSADVLEALGAAIDLSPAQVAQCLAETGIGFMFAPNHHPAMKAVAPVRRELGVRTLFNILGPLTNPAGAPNILMGVFHPDLVGIQARVLQRLGATRALIVWGQDGIDEISLGAPTLVAELRDGKVREYEIDPRDLGFAPVSTRELAVADAMESRARVLEALENREGPAREIVALNAGAALYVSGAAESVRDGVFRARGVLASGAARAKLDQFAQATRRLSAQPAR